MSTLKVTTLQNLSGTEVYTCKAWVNFNGTGTVAIRASGNVSSITDNGTGDYTVNFTTAFANTDYSLVGTCNINLVGNFGRMVAFPYNQAPTTSTARIGTSLIASNLEDQPYISIAVFR